jgi:hypothetical protein
MAFMTVLCQRPTKAVNGMICHKIDKILCNSQIVNRLF